MTDTVGRPGQLAITRCASMCEACEWRVVKVQRCIAIAGPHGHVTLCFGCAGRWLLQATLDENGKGLRAFSVLIE